MKKTIALKFDRFEDMHDYERLESHAKYIAYDYCVSLKVIHQPRKWQAVWEIDGEQEDIDNFLCCLDI